MTQPASYLVEFRRFGGAWLGPFSIAGDKTSYDITFAEAGAYQIRVRAKGSSTFSLPGADAYAEVVAP